MRQEQKKSLLHYFFVNYYYLCTALWRIIRREAVVGSVAQLD